MQLIGVQLDIAWEDRQANHAKVANLLTASPPTPGALVVLPEMFSSGFSMNVANIAEDENKRGEQFLSETAKRFGVYLIGGLVTRGADGRGRNEALVASPDGQLLARYCKLHPFTPGDEAAHYCAGGEIVTFPCGDFTVAPFICYDLRFPEVFRIATRRRANVFVVIANWPSSRVEHWTTLLKARAIENQAYVLGVNRCGSDPNLAYPGRSIIFHPNGEPLAQAGDGEQIITAEANFAALTDLRRRLPVLEDIRGEFLNDAAKASS